MANATLSPEVTDVLKRSTITGNVLVLPPGQLDRKLYEAVNKALTNAGGKWKKGTGHVFPSDPRAKLDLALETGVSVDEKKKFQAFYTPAALAAEVVQLAEVSGKSVLEPSAGAGAIVKECFAQGAKHATAVELNPEAFLLLGGLSVPSLYTPGVHFACYEADFLSLSGRTLPAFDRVVMNPPFTKGQDIEHVLHALKFLKPGGRLVAIMSPTVPASAKFSAGVLAAGCMPAKWRKVPEGTFKESGTNIRTVIAIIDKLSS
jgi:predicted RNA methylase